MSIQIRRYHTAKALLIQRSLGTRHAAGYLRNKGFSFEFSCSVLCSVGHLKG